MEIFIHIGYPKTGSTAIQSHVATNLNWLLTRGVYIPQTGYGSGGGHQHILPGKFGDTENQGVGEEIHAYADLLTELDRAEASGYDKALLTWEGLAGASLNQVLLLARALRNHRAVILAYVREDGQRYESGLLQQIEKLRFPGGVNRVFSRPDFIKMLENASGYFEQLENWNTAFQGQGKIRTKIYDRARFVDGNIVLDFLSWLGLSVDSEFMFQPASINPSIDVRSSLVLLLANKIGLDHGTLVHLSKALSANLKTNGAGPRRFLTSSERKMFWERFEKDNKLLFKKYRPENALPAEAGFPEPTEGELDSDLKNDLIIFREVFRACDDPDVYMWQGNTTVRHSLNWVLGAPCSGWSLAGNDGIWSNDECSTIRFRLPQTHVEAGPVAINLLLAGAYADGISSTIVEINGSSTTRDISRITLRINIDEKVRAEGVSIKLCHDLTQLTESPDSAQAFQLRFMSYKFTWDHD